MQIRDAAWKLVAMHGYDALTFEAIAQATGCSRTTLYRRYASKAELVTSVLNETIRALKPEVDESMAPRDVLITLVLVGARYLAGERGAAILNVAAIAQRSPELAQVIDGHLALVSPHYFTQFRRLAPEAEADDISFALHTLIGSMVHHVAFRRVALPQSDIERLVDQAIRLVKGG